MALYDELRSVSQDPKAVYPDIDAIMSNWTYINIFFANQKYRQEWHAPVSQIRA